MTRLEVGDNAPNFNVPATGNRRFTLREFRGRPVVLVFYPGDATPTCTAQLNSYTDSFDDFEAMDAIVLAISPQDIDSHEAFTAEHNFAFPLLYDEDKLIGEEYGVVGPLGFYRRSVVVVNPEGKVAYINRVTAGLNYPSTDQIVKALQDVRAAA